MKSSYIEEGYDKVFFALIEAFRPMKCVEFGILDGFSTLAIAEGLKHNFEMKYHGQTKGHLDSYDLFEDCPYGHGDINEVNERINNSGLSEFVTIHKGDAYKVWENYEDKSIHFLHIDIGNTGEILKDMMELWNPKVQVGGIIAFEGGDIRRDNVCWMQKYKKPGIAPELLTNQIIKSGFVWGRYKNYPSLTVMLKKWDGNIWYDIQGNPHVE